MKKAVAVISVAVVLAVAGYLVWRGNGQVSDGETVASPVTQEEQPETSVINAETALAQGRLWEKTTFADAYARAQSGDPDAQWIVSQIYDYCFEFNFKNGKLLRSAKEVGEAYSGSKREAVIRNYSVVEKKLAERCRHVDNGQPIPMEAVTLWLAQSAKGGNIAAKVKNAALSSEKPEKEELLDILSKAMASKSPSAVFEMGTLVHSIKPEWVDPKIAPLFSRPAFTSHAFHVAACRAGYDCSISSAIMYYACQQGGCVYDNFERYILQENITAGQKGELEEMVRLVNEYFL